MTDDGSVHATRIRVAEVIAASCLATDLGMGFPFEHGRHATLMAMRLADKLDVDPKTATQTLSLLMNSGCTTDAEIRNRIFRGGMTQNVTPVQFGSPLEVLPGLMRGLATARARASAA